MKLIKCSLLLICAAALVVGMLSGCGGTAGNGKEKVVTIWSPNMHSKLVYDRLIGEWNETIGKEKGIRIDYTVKESSSMTESLKLAFQSCQEPNMFIGGPTFRELLENDQLLTINELPGGDKLIEKYKNKAVSLIHYIGDKYYTLPSDITTGGMVYNKDMFRAAGIVDEKGEPTPPKTWAQVREYAKRLTNPQKQEYGIILPLKWSGAFNSNFTIPMMSSIGYDGYNPATGKWDYTSLEPIIDAWMGMKADGSIFPGSEGMDNDPARAMFSKGGVGMKLAYSFDVGVFNDQFPTQIDLGVAPFPVIDENNRYYSRMVPGYTFRISKSAAEKVGLNALAEVYNFFASDDFIRSTYAEAVSIPVDWNIVKDVKLENPKKGWVEFCKFADTSVSYNNSPTITSELGGIPDLRDYFLASIWTGKSKETVRETLLRYNDIMNAATEKYYAAHPERDRNEFVNPSWVPVK